MWVYLWGIISCESRIRWVWGQKHKATKLALSLRSTQLIYNVWEIEIHNRKINKMVEGKDKKIKTFYI